MSSKSDIVSPASQNSAVPLLQPWTAQDLLRAEGLKAQTSREKYHLHLAKAVDAGLLSLDQAKCEYHPTTEAEIAAGLARTNDTAEVYFASRDTVVHRRPLEVEELLQVFDKGSIGAYVLRLEAEVHGAERFTSMAKEEVMMAKEKCMKAMEEVMMAKKEIVVAREKGWAEAKEEAEDERKMLIRKLKETEREVKELRLALGVKLEIRSVYLAMRAEAFEAGRQDMRDEIDVHERVETPSTQRDAEKPSPDDSEGPATSDQNSRKIRKESQNEQVDNLSEDIGVPGLIALGRPRSRVTSRLKSSGVLKSMWVEQDLAKAVLAAAGSSDMGQLQQSFRQAKLYGWRYSALHHKLKSLLGLRVLDIGCGDQNMPWCIEDFVEEDCTQIKYFLDDGETWISIFDYFQQYGRTMLTPGLPLVKMSEGSQIYFPIDVLRIAPGNPWPLPEF
ncbi:hypothetical protein BU16DRAFT_577234 [Lophium mytilinum]|uniref:PAZ domain-containing protein n=1 Tax=Lophium mytilinum TaxID=390894 RepID=A0A6A6RB51_9PEZI|nr:hypothetical protein BU16DRAFT_577234 [Lophium mytilinum]